MSLTDTDSRTLKMALEKLEADRERIIQEKVERGEAVREPVIVAGVSEAAETAMVNILARLRQAGETREVIFGDGSLWEDGRLVRQGFEAIITGVPRSGRDDDTPRPVSARKSESKSSWKCYQCGTMLPEEGTPHRCEPSSGRPKLSPPPQSIQPEPEPERHYIRVEIRPASENDPGQIIEGRYAVIGSLVQVWDLNGRLLGSGEVRPDEDSKSVARKILRAKSDCGNNNFYRPLRYPNSSIH
jgi:hypothetical protein